MTLTLLLFIGGIALLDSLNPSLFVAQLYLLTTERPVPRVLSYVAGVLLVNFTGGVLVLVGVRAFVVRFWNTLSNDMLCGGELAVGLALVAFGVWIKTNQPGEHKARKSRSLQPIHTFLLGIIVMLNEITTALPYFVAIERIAQAQLSTSGNLFSLVVYNLVFSLPLLGFLMVFVTLRQRFVAQIRHINQGIQVWTPRILKYGSLLFGGVLALDAVSYFVIGGGLLCAMQ